ncbi:hypothetical protein GK047_18085 [Paenibacillus sp. SYP-B3998]|uniref:Uncharacterized protein n=1 Tax=Paenibacillus sp. SYP-B3998 TaxID=2678564 RepID=A0A6G4A0J4_9BACL|nr:hypothetical protein [Paenibacillus sp. SYP-B3998]NEW07912.1 hypothetical protein [Paenibacillus sp. SYP-B3998]
MKNLKHVTTLFTALMLASAVPTAAAAASVEITASMKSSIDKMITSADRTQAGKINSLYNELLTLQKQEQDWDVKINAQHTANAETLVVLNKQIKAVDGAKLDKLEADVAQTRGRHKLLLDRYSSLNKQIDAAKLLKDKDLNSALRFQATLMRIPVQLARMDIKNKEKALQTAKEQASKTIKKIRATLADNDQVKTQIKAKKSAIKTIDTSVNPVWSAFKQAVKKEEPTSVLSSLSPLVSLIRQLSDEKQNMYKLETKINDTLAAVKAQLP